MEIIKVDQMASKVVELPQLSLEEIILELDSGFEFPAEIYNCQITSYQTFCTSTAVYHAGVNSGNYNMPQPNPQDYPYYDPYSYPSPASSPDQIYSQSNDRKIESPGYIAQLMSNHQPNQCWEPKMKKQKSYNHRNSPKFHQNSPKKELSRHK